MKKIKTVAYLIGSQRRYLTIYQDLLHNYYYAYCDINNKTSRCEYQSYIRHCSERWIKMLMDTNAPVTKTHYVDPAGNLISVAPNENN
jgi:hypothetical protein